MKVILLQDIKNIGRRHEAKSVSDGYARNFLFPRKLAIPAVPEALKKIEKKKLVLAAEEKELSTKLKAVTDGDPIKFYLKTGAKGEIYTSIKAEDIAEELERRGLENIKVKLEKPIKNLGLFETEVDWRGGTSGKIKILVEPSPQ